MTDRDFKAIVIGASAGGLEALRTILTSLDKGFSIPILIVQHISAHSDNYITIHLDSLCHVHVKEADEKEKIEGGKVYFAPPNFHMMIEDDHTISFSIDHKVNYARPSVDVLFETAAYTLGDHLIGVVLTGANHDGAEGLKTIKEYGGLTIVQDPKTAESKAMPLAAKETAEPHYIYSLKEIADLLNKIYQNQVKNKD